MAEDTTDPLLLDWVHLPPDAEELSLWECLHDALIVDIRSDLLNRTLTLCCKVHHLTSSDRPDLRFLINFDGVDSVRVERWKPWPGELTYPTNATSKEKDDAFKLFQSKGRYESCKRGEFEEVVRHEAFDIYFADIAFNLNQCALKLSGTSDDESYHLNIRSEAVHFARSDNEPWSLELFLAAGRAYWSGDKKKS